MQKDNIARARANHTPSNYPSNLTPRERQVVAAMAEFGSRKVVADRLHISESTLSSHLRVIGVKSGSPSIVLIVSKYLRATLGERHEQPA